MTARLWIRPRLRSRWSSPATTRPSASTRAPCLAFLDGCAERVAAVRRRRVDRRDGGRGWRRSPPRGRRGSTCCRCGRTAARPRRCARGCATALGRGAELVGYLDADLSTPPARDLPPAGGVRRGPASRRSWARAWRCSGPTSSGARCATTSGASSPAWRRRSCTRASTTRSAAPSCSAPRRRSTAALATPFLSRWAFDVELLGRLLTGGDGRPGAAALGHRRGAAARPGTTSRGRSWPGGDGAHPGDLGRDRRSTSAARRRRGSGRVGMDRAALAERCGAPISRSTCAAWRWGGSCSALVLIGDLLRRIPWLRDFYSNAGLIPNHTVLWRPPFPRIFSFFFMASLPEESALWFGIAFVCFFCFLDRLPDAALPPAVVRDDDQPAQPDPVRGELGRRGDRRRS